MPAAMDSSPNPPKTLKILWKSLYFLQISSKMFFFYGNLGKSPRISRICSEISPAGLGISRPGSRSLGPAEILRISQPRKIGFRRCPYRQKFFWWDASFRSRWFRMFLNFSPISILLDRMAILSAAVPPTPPTGSLVRTLGGPLIRGSPNLVEINKINRNQ